MKADVWRLKDMCVNHESWRISIFVNESRQIGDVCKWKLTDICLNNIWRIYVKTKAGGYTICIVVNIRETEFWRICVERCVWPMWVDQKTDRYVWNRKLTDVCGTESWPICEEQKVDRCVWDRKLTDLCGTKKPDRCVSNRNLADIYLCWNEGLRYACKWNLTDMCRNYSGRICMEMKTDGHVWK